MEAKYIQIIFFIVALIITAVNVYNRFFTKRVIIRMGTFITYRLTQQKLDISRCIMKL